jgi:uncharacterized protein YgbK (DUF1537 family)
MAKKVRVTQKDREEARRVMYELLATAGADLSDLHWGPLLDEATADTEWLQSVKQQVAEAGELGARMGKAADKLLDRLVTKIYGAGGRAAV